MATNGTAPEGQDEGETRPQGSKTIKHFRKTPHKTIYVPLSSELLTSQFKLMHNMADSSLKHYNPCWWADCCSTMVRNVDCSQLGHPQHQLVTIRKLFQQHSLTNLEKFVSYMLTVLPKNDVGLILLPQINMEHPGNIKVKIEEDAEETPVKMEEERPEEVPLKDSNAELLQTILAKQQEQDAKLNEMLQKMNDLSLEQQKLAMKVKLLQGEVEALFKTDDEREIQHSKTRDQMEALKTAFDNVRLQMNEIDFKVTVLVDDCKVNKPSLSRQITAGVQSFSRFDKRPQ